MHEQRDRCRAEGDVDIPKDGLRQLDKSSARQQHPVTFAATSKQIEADEPGDVVGSRPPGHVQRRTLLDDAAMLDDDKPICQHGGVDRVVRHEQRCSGEIGQVATHLGAYQQMGFRVEGSERLIQQEQPRLGRKSTGQCHSLSLASRH